jgi:hypothetical protein
LLPGRGERQGAQRVGADFLAAVGVQNRLDDARNGKPLAHQPFGHAEAGCDLACIQPLLLHGGERLVLVDLVHRQMGDVLGQRRLDGLGIVAFVHDDDRHGFSNAFPGQSREGQKTPLPGDDLEAFAVGPHQQRLE